MCHSMCVDRGQRTTFGSLGDLIKVIRLGGKHPYLTSHLLALRSISRLRKMEPGLEESRVQI